jgi:protein TonB
MDQAQERRLFFTSLMLSAGLHLALVGAGVMTGWGRTLVPAAVLEVQLVPAPAALGGEGPGPRENLGASALSTPAPARPPAAKKKALARTSPPVPPPKPARVEAPASPPSLALAVPPRSQGYGSQTLIGSTGSRGQPGETGSGGPPSSPGVGPGPAGGGSISPAQGHYLSLIRARILARRHYPPLARQRQQEGVVRVRFRLSPSGALNPGVEVVSPSGFQILDEQARQCVLAAGPFPPIPREMQKDHLTIEVPIVYRLMESE